MKSRTKRAISYVLSVFITFLFLFLASCLFLIFASKSCYPEIDHSNEFLCKQQPCSWIYNVRLSVLSFSSVGTGRTDRITLCNQSKGLTWERRRRRKIVFCYYWLDSINHLPFCCSLSPLIIESFDVRTYVRPPLCYIRYSTISPTVTETSWAAWLNLLHPYSMWLQLQWDLSDCKKTLPLCAYKRGWKFNVKSSIVRFCYLPYDLVKNLQPCMLIWLRFIDKGSSYSLCEFSGCKHVSNMVFGSNTCMWMNDVGNYPFSILNVPARMNELFSISSSLPSVVFWSWKSLLFLFPMP